MITGIVKGKLLLTVHKFDNDSTKYRNHEILGLTVLSADIKDKWIAYEDLYGHLEFSDEIYPKMKIGEKITLKCKYKIIYSCDYFGEYDADFEFDNIKILRRVQLKYPYIEKSGRNQ